MTQYAKKIIGEKCLHRCQHCGFKWWRRTSRVHKLRRRCPKCHRLTEGEPVICKPFTKLVAIIEPKPWSVS